MSEQEINKIEVTIQECEKAMELHAALQRLKNNDDFKLIITEGYVDGEMYRQTCMLTDFSLPEECRTDAAEGLKGISFLLTYFRTLGQQAKVAADTVAAGREEQDLIRSEQE